MTPDATLLRARSIFLERPGMESYRDANGCVCTVGAVIEARGEPEPPPEHLDEWPEIRALAQAVHLLGLRQIGGGFLLQKFLNEVTSASDAAVADGDPGRMSAAFELAAHELSVGLHHDHAR